MAESTRALVGVKLGIRQVRSESDGVDKEDRPNGKVVAD